MSFFEDLVDRAGRILGIVTTTGGDKIATEDTVATLATEATVGTLATEAGLTALTDTFTLAPGATAAGLRVAQANIQDAGNTNLTTLAAGQTWTGTYVDTTGYSQVVTNFRSNKAGTFSLVFSTDGITADRTLGPYTLAANTDSPQPLTPIRRYYRASYTNTSGDEAALRIETRLSANPGMFQTRLGDGVSTLSTATLNRAVLFGVEENGNTYTNVKVRQRGALAVHLDDPLGSFGDVLTAQLVPRIQIDAVYGILPTDHASITAGGGTVTESDSMFVCQTGTGVGDYGVLRSRRSLRCRPGQGARFRWTALYTTGVADSFQFAGAFSATEAIGFAYSGTSFGVLRRIAGALHIVRLTLTVGSGGAENVTVTLNGVPFVVASGGALSTSGLAERLAEVGVFTGWSSLVSPQSNGATVTFMQNAPAVAGGAYTLSSTGTAAGTFATLQVGAPNDDITGFVPQASWNLDVMDGSGSASNPSGILLDPTKLNIYEVSLPYLGADAITYYVRTADGGHQEVHRIEYPNSATIPNMKNPTLRLGWVAASLGSSTNLTVKGASAAGFVEGELVTPRDPFGASVIGYSAATTEYVALAIRVSSVFANKVNQREIVPLSLLVGTETSNRVVRVRLVLNPTMTGTVNWGYADSTRSGSEVVTPTTIQPSGGSDVGYSICASGAPATLDLGKRGLQLVPGDVLAICVQTASGTAVTTVALNWDET